MSTSKETQRWVGLSNERARLESDIRWHAAGAGVNITPKRNTDLIRHINAYRSEIGINRTIKAIADLTDDEARTVREYYKGKRR